MDMQQFPVMFSVLSGSALEERILSKYGIERPYQCRFFTQGVNDIYIVKTAGQTYYLRVTLVKWRRKSDLEAEIDLLNYLSEKGLSVSVPLQDKDGCVIHEIAAPEGIRYAVLFSEAKGDKNDNPNQQQHRTLGRTVAQIHTLTDKITLQPQRFELDFRHLLDEPLQNIKPFLQHRKADYESLLETAQRLKMSIGNTLSNSKPEYGICHGDIHHGNIHFHPDGKSLTLFDFDCFGCGWRAYDIAVYLWHQQLNRPASGTDDQKETQWGYFLEGYQDIRPLGKNELAAVASFVAIRDIWLLGLQLGSLNRNRGCDWLGDGYFDFHLQFINKWST